MGGLRVATFQEIRQAVTNLKKEAVETAATVIVTESLKFVPIFSGRLRRAHKITSDGKSRAIVEWGTPYVAAHYFGSLRHVFESGLPVSVSNVRSTSERAKTTKRLGAAKESTRYQRDYRAAKAANRLELRYPDGAKWLERAANEPGVIDKFVQVLINKF